jgi:cell division protein FtsB
MAAVDWFAPAEVAERAPAPQRRRAPARRPAAPVRSRRKATQRRVRGHIVWMTLFALLLFGVVAVNVAVLQAHVAVSKLDQKREQLEARNQALASELSAVNSAPRIEGAARRLGFVQASAGNTSYLDLTAGRR